MANFDQQIYNQAILMGVPANVAKLIVSQARYETNDYTSNVFKKYNNAFGYKFVGQKKWPIGAGGGAPSQDAQGNADGGIYANYKSVADSTGEIVDWLKRRQAENKFKIADLNTPQAYANALKNAGYYGQSFTQYAAGLLSKSKNVIIAAGSGLAILLIVAGFFL